MWIRCVSVWNEKCLELLQSICSSVLFCFWEKGVFVFSNVACGIVFYIVLSAVRSSKDILSFILGIIINLQAIICSYVNWSISALSLQLISVCFMFYNLYIFRKCFRDDTMYTLKLNYCWFSIKSRSVE